jgi:hypothetical protein
MVEEMKILSPCPLSFSEYKTFFKKISVQLSPHRLQLGRQASKDVNKHKARSPIASGSGDRGFKTLKAKGGETYKLTSFDINAFSCKCG